MIIASDSLYCLSALSVCLGLYSLLKAFRGLQEFLINAAKRASSHVSLIALISKEELSREGLPLMAADVM